MNEKFQREITALGKTWDERGAALNMSYKSAMRLARRIPEPIERLCSTAAGRRLLRILLEETAPDDHLHKAA